MNTAFFGSYIIHDKGSPFDWVCTSSKMQLNFKGNDITKLFMREGEFLIGEALFMEESLEVFEAVEPLILRRQLSADRGDPGLEG